MVGATPFDPGEPSRPLMRVLIAEDDPRDAKLTASVIEGGVGKSQFDVVNSLELFRERLEKTDYDVILADFNLCNWTAFDALDFLKRSGKDIPLIVVTGNLGDEAAAECIKRGAADFVLKDRPARLPVAVERALEEKRLRTESQQAFEAVTRLATIVQSSDDASIAMTLAGVITSWNKGAEKVYGYSASEVFGQPVSVLVPPDRSEETPRLLASVGNGTRLEHFATVRVRKDGSLVNVSLSIFPITDSRGNVAGVASVARDITAHKRAEEVRAYLASIVESSDDAIIGKTPEGIIRSWNRSAEKLYGYLASEITGQSIFRLVPPERHEEVADFLHRIKRGETIERHETTRVTKSGDRVDVSISISPLRNSTGEVAGASTIARDITERQRAERELRQVNRALRTISEGKKVIVRATEETPLLEAICDTFVREGGYRMAWVGFAEPDAGKSVRPVAYAGFENGYLQIARISWEDTERGRGPMGTAIRTGRPVVARSTETEHNVAPWREEQIKRDYASLVALPILLQEHPLGALTIYAEAPDAFDSEEVQLLTGLTEDLAYGIQALRTRAQRQQAEEALAQQARQLLYSEEALKQKAQELARSNAELQQFVYVASHDLQEPLRTMASFAQVLKKRYHGKLDASADDFIHFIVDGATRMQELIHDLLAYSRVGSRAEEFVPTDCTRVIEQAVANLQAAIAESAAAVTWDSLPTIPCDGNQLVQVFQNLIGNAIKFRGSEAPQVHIAAEQKISHWPSPLRTTALASIRNIPGKSSKSSSACKPGVSTPATASDWP
jgi:PAS domain S-box-containing protein